MINIHNKTTRQLIYFMIDPMKRNNGRNSLVSTQ